MRSLEHAFHLLPPPIKAAVKAARWRAVGLLDPLLMARFRSRTGDSDPLPPARLRARIGALTLDGFVEGGRAAAGALEHAAADAGRRVSDCRAVLDFGCGCGRVLRHIYERRIPGERLYGSDIDEESVRWLAANFPDASFTHNDFEPPLPYPAGSFDLVYTVSVLSHLDQRGQDAWLGELERVLRPGGLALLSLHGSHAFEAFRSRQVVTNGRSMPNRIARHESLSRAQFVFEPYERNRWNATDFDGLRGPYGLAFHTSRYLEDHLPADLRLVRWLPVAVNDWQDLAVVRRSGQERPA